MIKDIINENESVTPNSKGMEILKENFPYCFRSDGTFDIERFKEFLNTKIEVTNEGYELKFLGKNYARLLASLDTTTVITPDENHNHSPENADSKNVYISGDNLDGLKHLLKSYDGQIDCIYIDPPYNTGSDGFVYNDSFSFTSVELQEKLSLDEASADRILDLTKRGSASHSAWLMFMYPRLLLARDLLSDNGIIFISIDDNEQANCKLICDDIFGENNFLTCVTRATGTPTGGGFDGLVNELDYVLIYARNVDSAVINGMTMSDEDASIYNEVDEEGNRFLTRSLRRTGGEDRREDRPTMYYPLISPDGEEIYPIGPTGYESRWICGPAKAQELIEEGLIKWKKTTINGNETWHPYQVYYLENRTKKPGNIWKDYLWPEDEGDNPLLWDDIDGNKKATREIRKLFDDVKVFETAKPVGLLERIVSIASSPDATIVDFFGGSSTTAHAIMKMNAEKSENRKYIIIQLQEPVKEGSDAQKAGYKTVDEIGIDRIRFAAQQIKKDTTNSDFDYGFKHYVLTDTADNTIDKLEKFAPSDNGFIITNGILEEYGEATVLTTWLIRDGYGFNTNAEIIEFADYKAHYVGKHLYLIQPNLSNEAIAAITDKYESDGTFNPENVVLFGYSFTWAELETLKTNLARLRDEEKNLRINYDVRY